MQALNIRLTSRQLIELKERKREEKSVKVFKRLECIYLKHKKISNKDIAELLGISRNTVRDWTKLFLEQGFEGLSCLNYEGRRSSKIDSFLNEIKAEVNNNLISTLKQLQQWIKENHDITIEESWLSRLIKKNSIYLSKKLD